VKKGGKRWNDHTKLFVVGCFGLARCSFFTRIAQPQMGEIIPNDLPLKFPGRNTKEFPYPWPDRDLPKKKGKTPKRGTTAWEAIIDFKESRDWDTGDLQKFANYFGVAPSGLCDKIKASVEERRRARVLRGTPLPAHGGDAAQQIQGGPLPPPSIPC